MGYYDDHAPSRRQRKRPKWIMPTIVGLILGAALVILALPALIQSNLLPYTITEQNENNAALQGDQTNQTVQNVNVNVNTQVTDVVANVSDAVVGIVNIQHTNFWSQDSGQVETGSGVIYKKANGYAYIVTNNHVVEGADELQVSLNDGTQIKGEILGSDLFTDLAVVRIDDKDVKKVIEMGSSDEVKIGEPAIAIGNPLGLRFAGSVTEGIISGKQRAIPQDFNNDGVPDWQAEVIQTDAAINPGNSGGALINIKGQLIGINSMKIARSAVEGIGFAIPIDSAKPIIKELEANGKVTRPYMGVEAYSLSEVPQYHWSKTLHLPDSVDGGVYLESVEPMSPASEAGLQRLDVIVKLDDEPIKDIIDLRKHLYQQKHVGDKMKITFYRDGKKQEVTMTLSSQG